MADEGYKFFGNLTGVRTTTTGCLVIITVKADSRIYRIEIFLKILSSLRKNQILSEVELIPGRH
jgi:hypothetical protein